MNNVPMYNVQCTGFTGVQGTMYRLTPAPHNLQLLPLAPLRGHHSPSSAQTPLSRKFKKENIAKVRNCLDLTIFYSLFGLGNSYGHGNSHLCHDLGHGLVLVPGDIVLTNTLYFAHFSQRE